MTGVANPPEPTISIVVGVQYAQENLPAILSAIRSGATTDIEVLLCHAENDLVDPAFAKEPDVRIIACKNDAVIPELWRDGIVAARANKVAILSAHCIPDRGWLDAAIGLDLTQCAGYGGPIRNSAGSDTTGLAIHLLRYFAFCEIPVARPTVNIAADNSVYDRAEIVACADLLPLGFWEPSYHNKFRARGLELRLTPELRATHTNQYTVRQFMAQRRYHGRAFGRARGLAAPVWRRWLMLAFSPAAFPIHAAKLTARIMKTPVLRTSFWRAAPEFYLFMANWSLGEIAGYASAAFVQNPVTTVADSEALK